MKMNETGFSQGLVEIVELPARVRLALIYTLQNEAGQLDAFLDRHSMSRLQKGNLVFNFPREQYAKLDRGETPEAINAAWFTLSNDAYTDPAVTVVSGETLRVPTTTTGPGADPKHSIFRFALDVGQFVGIWQNGILIGGASASSTPGTGKIVAAVNGIKDDTGSALSRDGSTIHVVTWKLKHLDASEV